MKTDATDMGMNKTGIQTSPLHSKALIEAAQSSIPSSPGDAMQIAAVRVELAEISEPVGKVPPPARLKGMATTAMTALKGEKANVLLDKIGARLAFERTGVRLYEALLSKYDAFGSFTGGPTREELMEIRAEELRHFGMLAQALEKLGADPTAMTPGADVEGTMSLGFPQVLTDPRTRLPECLRAIVAVELVDNDSWELLARLARAFGQEELASKFEGALAKEALHLSKVKGWLESAVQLESGAELAPASVEASL